MIKDRHYKLLELLPKHNWKVAPAAIEAGFSESTAYKQGKSLLQTALKKQQEAIAQRTKELATNKDIGTKVITSELKRSIAEQIGLTREEVYERVKTLAMQDRDLATALKVIKALAKDLGVDISEETTQNTTVPILNVVMESPKSPTVSHIIDHPVIESQNVDCATLDTEEDTGGTV